jgi:phosphate starvation-inducible protein PhoH
MAIHNQRRLTRKEKRIQANDPNFKKGEEPTIKLNFNLKKIEPLTENQRLTFESYGRGKNLMLHGIAGTGKSFISL